MSSSSKGLELLVQALDNCKKEKETPWMEHLPIPRVAQILIQTVSLNLQSFNIDEYLELLEPLIIAGSDYTEALSPVLAKASRFNKFIFIYAQVSSYSDAKIWDILIKKLDGDNLSIDLIILTCQHRKNFFEEKHIQAFQELGQKYRSDVSYDPKSNNSITKFLNHKCSVNVNERDEILGKYKWLFSGVAFSCSLFHTSFSILNIFLKRCKYSVVSIKVVNSFSHFIQKTDNYIKFFPSDFIEIINLLIEPPCIHCNSLFFSLGDLIKFTKEIESCLFRITKRNDELRTILCMHSEWLSHLKDIPVVRTLFTSI